jgi:hypothetical protein
LEEEVEDLEEEEAVLGEEVLEEEVLEEEVLGGEEEDSEEGVALEEAVVGDIFRSLFQQMSTSSFL